VTRAEENRRLVSAFRDPDLAQVFARKLAERNARVLALRGRGKPSPFKVDPTREEFECSIAHR
jgi:hypothetical protein